MGDDLKKTWME